MQPQLPMSISQRTVLVDTATVRAVRGVDADTVFNWVDDSTLRWAWNVATGAKSKIRELRFWARDVIAPETTAALSVDQVIDLVLPLSREQFLSHELCQLLLISRPHLGELRTELGGVLVGHTIHVTRDNLVAFFHRRLIIAKVGRVANSASERCSDLRSASAPAVGSNPQYTCSSALPGTAASATSAPGSHCPKAV
jgi:hypothetical protein